MSSEVGSGLADIGLHFYLAKGCRVSGHQMGSLQQGYTGHVGEEM